MSKIFNLVVFPVETISDALYNIFNKSLVSSGTWAAQQENQWASAFGEVSTPPTGAYDDVAQSGLKVAGAMAVALFVLRLAIYNWNRLIGDDDDVLHVLGDWLTAGLLALVAGALLDLINQVGWWMMSRTIGNASSIARTFVSGMSGGLSGIVQTASAAVDSTSTSFMLPVISIAVIIASLLAVVGVLVAFASGHAAMYVMAAIGPMVMVAGVIPKMRWLRGLWLQGTVIIALLPVVTAGIFKVGIEIATKLARAGSCRNSFTSFGCLV